MKVILVETRCIVQKKDKQINIYFIHVKINRHSYTIIIGKWRVCKSLTEKYGNNCIDISHPDKPILFPGTGGVGFDGLSFTSTLISTLVVAKLISNAYSIK